MKFGDFIKMGQVRRASIDQPLINSLIKSAKKDLEFLNNLEINEGSARKMMVNYYDVLRSVLEAISSLNGYKVYSHEAFVYFLKERGEETISDKFDRFRQIRNKINYYGKEISAEEAKENIEEIKKIIAALIKKNLNKKEL